jgi:hypothetical protein
MRGMRTSGPRLFLGIVLLGLCAYFAVASQAVETLVFGVLGAACFEHDIRATLGGKKRTW